MSQINKSLCIIGASGFFGKSFISSFKNNLLKKYNISKIYCISRNNKNINKNLLNFKKVFFIKANISNIKELPIADYYIYATESSDINKYQKKRIVKIYYKCIKNFYELLIKLKKKDIKVIYLSSGSILKKKSQKYKNYNIVKKNSERVIKNLSYFKINASIARCYTFIGEYLPLNKNFAIGSFIKDSIEKRFIKINSNFEVYRSFMYIDDFIEWIMKILTASKKSSKTFDVGSDEIVEIGKVAEIISRLTNKKVLRPRITIKRIDRYFPSVSKTKKIFDLKYNYNLIESIKTTLKKIKKNEKKN